MLAVAGRLRRRCRWRRRHRVRYFQTWLVQHWLNPVGKTRTRSRRCAGLSTRGDSTSTPGGRCNVYVASPSGHQRPMSESALRTLDRGTCAAPQLPSPGRCGDARRRAGQDPRRLRIRPSRTSASRTRSWRTTHACGRNTRNSSRVVRDEITTPRSTPDDSAAAITPADLRQTGDDAKCVSSRQRPREPSVKCATASQSRTTRPVVASSISAQRGTRRVAGPKRITGMPAVPPQYRYS